MLAATTGVSEASSARYGRVSERAFVLAGDLVYVIDQKTGQLFESSTLPLP